MSAWCWEFSVGKEGPKLVGGLEVHSVSLST